jgi:hypothetical protein
MQNKDYITELLEDHLFGYYEDQFEKLPSIMQAAIDKMVSKMRADNTQRALIRWHVINDIQQGMTGIHHSFLFAFRFLSPYEVGTLEIENE